MATRCAMCFKLKEVVPPLPGVNHEEHGVCKSCYYDIDRIAGFLERELGAGIQLGLTTVFESHSEAATPSTKPPKTPRSKVRRPEGPPEPVLPQQQ